VAEILGAFFTEHRWSRGTLGYHWIMAPVPVGKTWIIYHGPHYMTMQCTINMAITLLL